MELTIQLFESQVGAVIRGSLKNADAIIDRERIRESERAVEYYRSIGYQKGDLNETFKVFYENVEEWKARPKVCYNLTKRVAHLLSTLYADEVQRTFNDQAAEALWKKHVRGFDEVMRFVDIFTLLTGTVHVRPIYRKDRDRIRFAIYTSDQMAYTPDPRDPTTAVELVASFNATKEGKPVVGRHFWSDQEFIETIDDTIADNDDFHGKNPYRVMPLVRFCNTLQPWGYFDEPAQDLVEANLTLNSLVNDLNFTVKFQTHSQLFTKGAPKDFVPKIGPARHVGMPNEEGVHAWFDSPNPNVSQAIETLTTNLRLFFSSRNVPENALSVAQSSRSGVAIVAEQSSLVEWRKSRITTMRAPELELIRMTLRVLGFHKGHGVRDWPEDVVTVDYEELKEPLSDAERTEWEWLFDQRLATHLDFIMAKNPEVKTREEALKIYLENKKFFDEHARGGVEDMPTPAQLNFKVPTDKDLEGDDDEEEDEE